MPITRKFIDWSQPALPTAAEQLIGRFASGGKLDLSDVVVVLPGRRACRRLSELLVELTEKQRLIYFPPQITTIGFLPELLYESKRPFATELTQRLVWVQALRELRNQAKPFIPRLPSDDAVQDWLDLGTLLWRQHRELAGDGFDFGDVLKAGSKIRGFPESNRWRFLRQVQVKYLALLDSMELWDLQTARLYAIEHRECQSDKEIVLVGTADMNRATRGMIDQIADRVTVLVHAPAKLASRFDQYGCIDPQAWTEADIDLNDEHVRIVDGPLEQAAMVTRCIAEYDGRLRSDEITIGVPDDHLVPHIQRQLLQCELPSRWVVGRKMADTSPFRLLLSAARFAQRGRFADLAALVRHPDVDDWLGRQQIEEGWLTQLDEYYNRHLQPRLGQWLRADDKYAALQQMEAAVRKLVEPLTGDSRRLGEWTQAIAELLNEVYSGVELNPDLEPDHFQVATFRQIRAVLVEQQSIPARVQPIVTSSQAVDLIADQLQSTRIPPRSDEAAIEMLGWLELPLDTNPALIVTSFNEGFVPTSINSDLFLPDNLRRQLGLVDNSRRYARDAYALSTLLATRPDITLIAARRDGEGNPRVPSRLAFATDRETVAQRSLVFFQNADAPSVTPALLGDDDIPEHSQFVVPRPSPSDETLDSLSVTAFRSYLACPYRFYLRYVLKLESIDDAVEELDAPTFGNVVHEVLNRFGDHAVRDSTNAGEIQRFLRHELNQYFDKAYGRDRLPAVEVQLMQLRARLDAFADWQARWAKRGWQIRYTETAGGPEPIRLHGDEGRSLALRGRIDRIDYHPELDQWTVFDYKTSDQAKSPEQTHRRAGEWVDLQLPLYRLILASMGIEGSMQYGYIVLPKDLTKVGELIADWSDAELDQAEAVAMEVVQSVLNREFWPPTYPAPNILTDYGAICQDNVFEPCTELAAAGSSTAHSERTSHDTASGNMMGGDS